MMIEMASGKRYVDVARFPDRLAVVERFDDGDQARMALNQARERIEVPGAGMSGELCPRALRLARCCPPPRSRRRARHVRFSRAICPLRARTCRRICRMLNRRMRRL
jgi:hypothetical protein